MLVSESVDFYVGMFQPPHIAKVRRAMVSINRLEFRKSDFEPPELGWMLDNGSFTRITTGQGHMPLGEYARQIARWSEVDGLVAAVAQDYMCEPFVTDITGMSIEQHQSLTTRNYIELAYSNKSSTYIMPVIQGFTPDSYATHTWQLAPILDEGAWVGVGSVCKRNSSPAFISAVLTAILDVRPDLRLHGFGLKTTSLINADIAERIHSADSMSWSFRGRNMTPSRANDPHWAREWADSIESMPIRASQLAMAI